MAKKSSSQKPKQPISHLHPGNATPVRQTVASTLATRSASELNPKPAKPVKSGNPLVMLGLVTIIAVLFGLSVFKNIAYPLFWADESMTMVGSQRVQQFGYPKVHDGKNVWYDLRHTATPTGGNSTIGINKADDAYIGGTSWGHYYFGLLGLNLTNGENDLYAKTGTIRNTFALVGVLGIALLCLLVAGLFSNRMYKLYAMLAVLMVSLLSVPLAMLLREVRYYPLTVFLLAAVAAVYCLYRFGNRLNGFVAAGLLGVLLWALFMTFSPVYFIALGTLGVSEVVLWTAAYLKTRDLIGVIRHNWLMVFALGVSVGVVFPLLGYFKTFEISAAMAQFNQFTDATYRDNLSTAFGYFAKFELLWLAVVLKIGVALLWKPIWQQQRAALQSSLLLTGLFVAYLVLIARVPNFMFTRYLIPAQPILSAALALDIVSILAVLNLAPGRTMKLAGLWAVVTIFAIVGISRNRETWSGHLTELNTPYKGPLDYAIPFITSKTNRPDTLTIATNYEETSFMYYFGAKTVVGFVGNNLPADSTARPDFVLYRRSWGNYPNVFNGFLQRDNFKVEKFPVADLPVNNIPEVNFRPPFNHYYKTVLAEEGGAATEIYYK